MQPWLQSALRTDLSTTVQSNVQSNRLRAQKLLAQVFVMDMGVDTGGIMLICNMTWLSRGFMKLEIRRLLDRTSSQGEREQCHNPVLGRVSKLEGDRCQWTIPWSSRE